MALVLLMEGTNQFVSWRHIIEYLDNTFGDFINAFTDPNSTFEQSLQALNVSMNIVLNSTYLVVYDSQYSLISDDFNELSTNVNLSGDESLFYFREIFMTLLQVVFNGYGFEPPEDKLESDDFAVLFAAYMDVFKLVFAYFFISAGFVLMFLGVLSWLSHSKGLHESRSHLGGIISKFAIGLGLVFCSTMVLNDSADNLGETVWTLPALFFLLLIALIINHIPWSDFHRSRNQSLPTNSLGRQKKLPWASLIKTISRKSTH
jgi:hypothetical protein